MSITTPPQRASRGAKASMEYGCWKAMKERCLNPNHKAFPMYGGRGIGICAQWMSFDVFQKDMGPRPSTLHTLDRIENDKGYEPSNCRWATWIQQGRNRRNTKPVTINGVEYKTISMAAEALGIKRKTLEKRISRKRLSPDKLGMKSCVRRGEDCPFAKMDLRKAGELRRELSEMKASGIHGAVKIISSKYEISRELCWLITSGRAWV